MTTPPIDPTGIGPAPRVRIEDYYKADPELKKKTDALKQTLRDVSASMKNGQADLVAQRKSMAAQKVQRIRESIKALKMSGIIDAKVLARMAARLARELAAAVREYAAAGGDPKLNNSVSDSSATQTNIEIHGDIDAPAEAQSTEDTVPAAPPVPVEDSDAFVKAANAESAENINPSGAAQSYKTQQLGFHVEDDPDKGFADSVRDAVDELRKILRTHKSVMRAFDQPDDPDVKDAEKALQQVERALSGIDTGSKIVSTVQIST